jgi:hypothetical protein
VARRGILSVWPERGEKREEGRRRWEEREGGDGSHETYLFGESGWPGAVFCLSGLRGVRNARREGGGGKKEREGMEAMKLTFLAEWVAGRGLFSGLER